MTSLKHNTCRFKGEREHRTTEGSHIRQLLACVYMPMPAPDSRNWPSGSPKASLECYQLGEPLVVSLPHSNQDECD